jgi:hypothetical protein
MTFMGHVSHVENHCFRRLRNEILRSFFSFSWIMRMIKCRCTVCVGHESLFLKPYSQKPITWPVAETSNPVYRLISCSFLCFRIILQSLPRWIFFLDFRFKLGTNVFLPCTVRPFPLSDPLRFLEPNMLWIIQIVSSALCNFHDAVTCFHFVLE